MGLWILELPKKKEGKTFIYCLKHPVSKKIRYIGKANDPWKRYQRHIESIKGDSNTALVRWLRKLKQPPEMHLIEEIHENNWQEVEAKLIAEYRRKGFRLLNKQPGIINKLPESLKTEFNNAKYYRLDIYPEKYIVEFSEGRMYLLERANDWSNYNKEDGLKVKYLYLTIDEKRFYLPKSHWVYKKLSTLTVIEHGYYRGKRFYRTRIEKSRDSRLLDPNFSRQFYKIKKKLKEELKQEQDLEDQDIIKIVESNLANSS